MSLYPKRKVYLGERSQAKCTLSLTPAKHASLSLTRSEIMKTGPKIIKLFSCSTQLSMKFELLINITCVPAPKCGRRPHFGAVGIAGLYIGRLRNCLPFLTSFTQCRMANLHIKCFDINAYQRLKCYRALR